MNIKKSTFFIKIKSLLKTLVELHQSEDLDYGQLVWNLIGSDSKRSCGEMYVEIECYVFHCYMSGILPSQCVDLIKHKFGSSIVDKKELISDTMRNMVNKEK